MENTAIKPNVKQAYIYKLPDTAKVPSEVFQTASGTTTEAINFRPDLKTIRNDPSAKFKIFTDTSQRAATGQTLTLQIKKQQKELKDSELLCTVNKAQ